MYQIVIADDEPWVLYRIQNLIDWNALGFEIVGTAVDGLSALEIVKEKRPALLLSDIRMPGLDGLKLVREVKLTSPDTIVILITGFSEFSYAQEAVRQGVFDYMVKPVRKKELSSVLERVREHLYEKNSPEESDLFFSLLGNEKQYSISDVFGCMGHSNLLPYFCMVTAAFEQKLSDSLICKSQGEHPNLCLRTGTRQKSILLQLEQPQCDMDFLIEKSDTVSALYTGVSTIMLAATDFSVLLHQAETAMLTAALHKSSTPLFYATKTPKIAHQLMTRFSTALRSNERNTLLAVLDKLEASANHLQIDTILDLTNRMIALLCEHHYGNYEALELHYKQHLGISNILDTLISPLRQAIQYQESTQTVPLTQFRKIMNVIEENYMQDLRLSDISKQFYLTPNYLSILIKKETGATFSELLIHKRISLAKKLLIETELPVQDIMEQVGYKDYSCFIRLFKKHVNCTPYIYRKEAAQ